MPPIFLALIAALAVSQIAMLCTTVYLHRTLSHRALTMRKPLHLAFRTVTWITTGIKPREWVAVHRKHHAFTDIEGDPHSPVVLGWVRVQLTNPALYRRTARTPGVVDRYARDVPRDRLDRLVFDHAYVGLGLGIGVLCVVLGPWYGLLAAGMHTVVYLMSNSAVNAVGHHFGKRTYDNSATNSQWLAFLTLGEGLHNNHHAAPTSAKLSLSRGQIDPGWWFIKTVRSLGLARVRLDRVVLTSAASAGILADEVDQRRSA
ncbi:MAG TPA: fatty acid desaturase [Acidimicrobiales bacterium]